MLVGVERLRKLSRAFKHISTTETPWDLGARKTAPVFSPGSPTTPINMLLAWNTCTTTFIDTLYLLILQGQYSTFPLFCNIDMSVILYSKIIPIKCSRAISNSANAYEMKHSPIASEEKCRLKVQPVLKATSKGSLHKVTLNTIISFKKDIKKYQIYKIYILKNLIKGFFS